MLPVSNLSPSDKWLTDGGVAHDGMSYAPPTSAHPYGTSGCPLAPSVYRSELGETELPPALSTSLGASRLTVADLGLDVWNHLEDQEISPDFRQKLGSFLYQLPVPERRTAIPGGVPISWLLALPTNPRLHNTLARHYRDRHRNDILHDPMDCEDFLSIRQCGKTALIEILCVLESVERGVVQEQPQPRRPLKPKVMSEAQFQAAIQEATRKALHASDLLAGHLQELAAWALSETDSETLGAAISSAANHRSPASAWRAVTAMELTKLAEIPSHPYEVIDSWVADLPEREGYIFQKRVANIGGGSTLQQLAEELGITRERVRQLEKRVLSKFASFTQRVVASPVKWRIRTIKQMVGTAAPLAQVEQVLRPADGQIDYRFVLLRFAGPYDISGDWLVLRSAIDNDPTGKVSQAADEIGFIDQDLAERELTKWGLAQPYHRKWLNRAGRIREFNGRLARWDGSIGDKLVIGLADLGRPASVDALLDYIQEDRSRGSALNALSGDHRVVRVNRSEWALTSWGLPEYSSIAMSIRDLVSNSSTPVHIDEIISRMQNDFGSAEGSVRAYCYAPMFVVEGGWVSLRDDLDTFEYPNASPRTARGVFVLGPGRVALLVEVTEDLLRGSGRSVPAVLGAILDVPVNQELTFRNEGGASITVTYPETSFLGPTMGSTRSLAESAGARLGDYLTVVLDRSNMSVTGTATSNGEYPPGWQLVARLTGIEAGSGINGLAIALDCSVGEVRPTLRSRGDDAVAQAIPEDSSSSSGLDEALSRLEEQLQQR